MSEERRQRLEQLLRRRDHSNLLPGVLEAWFGLGVSASPLSFEDQTQLVTRLRVSEPTSVTQLEDITFNLFHGEIAKFTRPLDVIVVVGWAIDTEPAVAVPAEMFAQSILRLRTIYPDGFLLLEPLSHPLSSLLVIDFGNDDDPEINVTRKSFAVTSGRDSCIIR